MKKTRPQVRPVAGAAGPVRGHGPVGVRHHLPAVCPLRLLPAHRDTGPRHAGGWGRAVVKVVVMEVMVVVVVVEVVVVVVVPPSSCP